MSNELCPKDCEYINYTEHEQDMLDHPVLHKCLKYNVRLFHFLAHPDLYRCEQCFKENNNDD